MNRLFKLTALLTALFLVLSLAGCTPDVSNATYNIGICQLVQHDAHDNATQGFIDALNKMLPGQVHFNVQNASNEIPVCTSIVNQFIAEDVDLIMANATPALQAAASATAKTPILGTSVTDYAAVMDLSDFTGTVGGNVSGTSDLVSTEKQLEMIQAWFPNEKNIGMLFCSAEANSRYQIDVMTEALEKIGYECTDFSFTDANDLPLVLAAAINDCDLLYVPTDNAVAANSAIVDNYCRPAKLPVIGGDLGICSSCTVATLGLDYYNLGYKTGMMAYEILTGSNDISQMPVEYADCSYVYNAEICADLGLTPIDGYKAIEN